MLPDVIVFTSDKHLWANQPMAWLFNKYFSPDQRVIIVGFNNPDFKLPRNFAFYSVSTSEYDADHWVDAALDFFDVYQADKFIFFHEDYWLTRKVDVDGLRDLVDLMNLHTNILRIDITADRLYAGGMKDVFYWKRFDIIEARDSQYQMSHQACIMRRAEYVEILGMLDKSKHSAWEVELSGTTIINNFYSKYRVLGTRQFPLRYANALLKGKLDWNELAKLSKEDLDAVRGWIPERYTNNRENSK